MGINSSARAALQTFGSFEELKQLFDVKLGGDVSFAEVKPSDYFSFLAQYRTDKVACLASLTLEHLSVLQRQAICIGHLLEESSAQHLELGAAAGRRCADVSAQLREAHEASKCRNDSLREKRLSRAGLQSGEVTKLRHIFEAADTARRGELDAVDFSALFPRAGPQVVSELWNAAVANHSFTIDFDEFLDVIIQNGAGNLLRSALRNQTPRPAVCTPGDAEEDAQVLATQIAEAVADQSTKLAVERGVCTVGTKTAVDNAQLNANMLEADVRDMFESLLQRVAEALKGTGDAIRVELQELRKSLTEQHATSLEELSQALQQNWSGFSISPSDDLTEPQVVQNSLVDDAKTAQVLRQRPTPLDGMESVGGASPKGSLRKMPSEPFANVGAFMPPSSLRGHLLQHSPAEMNALRLLAATPQAGLRSGLNNDTPTNAGDVPRQTLVGTSVGVEASSGVSYDTITTPGVVRSPASGSRTCLLAQTENLARQVSELDRFYMSR